MTRVIRVKIKQLMSAICMSRDLGLRTVAGLPLAGVITGPSHDTLTCRGTCQGFSISLRTHQFRAHIKKEKKERIIIEQAIKSMISKYFKKEKSRYLIARAEYVLCSRARAYLTIHGLYLNLNRHL